MGATATGFWRGVSGHPRPNQRTFLSTSFTRSTSADKTPEKKISETQNRKLCCCSESESISTPCFRTRLSPKNLRHAVNANGPQHLRPTICIPCKPYRSLSKTISEFASTGNIKNFLSFSDYSALFSWENGKFKKNNPCQKRQWTEIIGSKRNYRGGYWVDSINLRLGYFWIEYLRNPRNSDKKSLTRRQILHS